MPTATGTHKITIAGVEQSWNFSEYGDGELLFQPLVPVATASTDWTYASASTGSATAATGGIEDGTVDVYWTGGYRHGVTVAVSVDSPDDTLTFSGGAGDNFPVSETDLIISQQVVLSSVAFIANNLDAIAASARARCIGRFCESDDTAHDYEITAAQGLSWNTDCGLDNLLAGLTIDYATVSTADIAGVDTDPDTEEANAGCIVNIGILRDITTYPA